MTTLGLDSIPMLERYFLKAIAAGNQIEADRLKQQIIEIKGEAEPPKVDLDSGVFTGTEDEPLYPFLT
jgi:hypothetical protein